MQFRVLGPLEVARDGRLLHLGSRKQRTLLLLLLVEANRVVSSDRVLEDLWAGRPPPAATASVHSYVSNLRRVLEPDHGKGVFRYLGTAAGGYLLHVDGEELDASRFERLADAGRAALTAGAPQPAWRALSEAVGLWRGPAYADAAGETFARAEIARLEELRITAVEDRFDAALALGQHHRVVAEVEHVLADHALRERLHGQLMLALYRSGRQADALAAYRRAQALLAEELGIDPGPALRRLEAAVLAQSPELELAPVSSSAAARAETPSTAPTRLPGRAVIGRDGQLRVASEALAVALAGRGAMVLITGEPGIGKTRLAETLADQARGSGAEIRSARCVEGQAAPAFWPWLQLLRSVVEDLDDAVLREVAGDGAGELSRLLPELARRLGITVPEQGLDAASARFRLNDAVCRLLFRLARRRPLVLLLDDVQWWDAPSLRLLSHVTSQLGTGRLLLVATLRDADAQQSPLRDALVEMGRSDVVARIPLTGLTVDDVAAYLAHLTGREVPLGVARKVHRRTGGNPFFVGELVRLLREPDQLDRADTVQVPPTVREVIRHRVAALPAGAAEVLTVAAVQGEGFDGLITVAVTGMAEPQVFDLLDTARRAQLVDEDRDRPGWYRFAHALVREALYDDLPAWRRARLHAQVGAAGESRAGRRSGERAAELARHYRLAVPAGTAEKAVTYGGLAAEEAMSRLAYETAADFYRQALEVTDLADLPETVRGPLLLGLGIARRRSGDLVGARAALDDAVEVARREGDARLLAGAALACGGGGYWGWWIRFGVVDTTLIGYLQEALAAVSPGSDDELRADLLSRLAVELYFSPQPGRPRSLSADALAIARRLGNGRALGRALAARHLAIWQPDTTEERLTLAGELVGVAQAVGDREMEAIGLQFRIVDRIERCELTGVDADQHALERLSDTMHARALQVQLSWLRTMRAFLGGRFAETETLAREALHTNLTANAPDARAAFAGAMFDLRRMQGRHAELDELLSTGLADDSHLTDIWRATRAAANAELGRVDQARADFAHVLRQVPTLPRDMVWPFFGMHLAEACAALGDEPAAARLYEEFRVCAGRSIVLGTGHYCGGAADLYLGRLAATVRDFDVAVDHYEAALELNEALQARPFIAMTLLHLAEALAARKRPGDDGRADLLLSRCAAEADALQMTWLQRWARAGRSRGPISLGHTD